MSFSKKSNCREESSRMSEHRSCFKKASIKLKCSELYKGQDWCRAIGNLSLESMEECIRENGFIKIQDYTIYQASEWKANREADDLRHYWSNSALERLVARWYSDHPDGIGMVYEVKDEDRIDVEFFTLPSMKEGLPIVGYFKDLRCIEDGDKCKVVVNIYLFKAVKLPFFNPTSLGEVDYLSGFVEPHDCKLVALYMGPTTTVLGYEDLSQMWLEAENRRLRGLLKEKDDKACQCKCTPVYEDEDCCEDPCDDEKAEYYGNPL